MTKNFPFASVLVLGIFSPLAQAYQVTPLSAVLSFSGPKASATFEIENSSDTPIPIEVTMHDRKQDLDGKDIPDASPAADDKFIIFPPQLILDPKSHRSVRITWAGGRSGTDELAYRAIFQQLSVPVEKEVKAKTAQGSVKFLFEYAASVYVKPDGAAPKLVLLSAMPDARDSEKMALTIENRGTAHQIIKGFHLTLKMDNQQEFKTSDVEAGVLLNKNILAKSKLKILVPWPRVLKKGSYLGEFVPKT